MQTQVIQICGRIASGKTTLAKLFRNKDIHLVLEDFQTNPFWKAFYDNPIQYAFEAKITFLFQDYHQIKTNLIPSKNIA
jgi:deoxyadenosine/deoxycytidine kinase